MRYLKTFNEINESKFDRVVNKGKEILNFRTIKENDKIAKKYIDLIYKDWNEKKDLLKVFLNMDSEFITYRINDNEDTHR